MIWNTSRHAKSAVVQFCCEKGGRLFLVLFLGLFLRGDLKCGAILDSYGGQFLSGGWGRMVGLDERGQDMQ